MDLQNPQYWTFLGQNLAFLAIALVFLFFAKTIHDFLTPFNDDVEIREKRNMAVVLRRTGLYLGTVIAMAGVLMGPTENFEQEIVLFIVDGLVITIALLLAQFLNEAVMLRGVGTHKAVREGNVAVGMLECGQFIATGLVVNGAFTGEGGFQYAIVYALLGQVALLLVFGLYEALTKWNVRQEIASGNAAAGLAVGTKLAAIGLILQNSIAGDVTNWANDLTSFLFYFVYGLVILAVVNWLSDLVLLPGTRLRDEIVTHRNVASVGKVSAVMLAAAIIVWAGL